MRTIVPLDIETVVESVKRTSKVLVLHEAILFGGMGGEIAARIADKKADYVLALKGNQSATRDDAALYLADPALAAEGERAVETDAGHGRVEERRCRALDARWLAERHRSSRESKSEPSFRRWHTV